MKASAAAAVGAIALPAGAKSPGSDGLIHRNERPESMTYRKLGRTNYMCSRLVFGCGKALRDEKTVKLLESSFEAGINYYDVGSDVFYKGSERNLSGFLKRHRDDVWVTSKGPLRPTPGREPGTPLAPEEGKEAARYWTELLDRSLLDLGTDYVDAYYLMGVDDTAIVQCEELHNEFLTAKQSGKVGHWGVSTHKNAAQVLAAMTETDWYDLAMIAITPAGWYDGDAGSVVEGTPGLKDLQPALKAARDAGIGLVGMKAARFLASNGDDTAFDSHYDDRLMSSGLSGIQRSYAYVLQHGPDVVNADMLTFEHMDSNLLVARTSDEYLA